VALARAVALGPELVLADEPTGNLDPHTGRMVFEVLCSLQQEFGFALILASHSERLARSCKEVLRLADGQLRSMDEQETREYFGA
jgi:putative ABC transport system ATP-binding protein